MFRKDTKNPDRHQGYRWLRVDSEVAAMIESIARRKRTNYTRLANAILKAFAEGSKEKYGK